MMLDGLGSRVRKKYQPILKRLMFHWYVQESVALSIKEALAFDSNDRESTYNDRLALNCPPSKEVKTDRLKSLGDKLDSMIGKKND